MVDIYTFPKQEAQYYTRLSLKKYDRMPGSQPSLTTASSIRLPLPTALHDSFNMDISNPSFDLLGNSPMDVLTAGQSKIEDLQSQFKQGNFSVSQAVQLAAQAAAQAPGISDTGIGKFAQSVTGMVRNPHLTTIFEGVRLKTYQFTWKLSPKSSDEAQELNRLFTHIKGYMHPKIVPGGFALEYPYIATVSFVGPPSAVMPNVQESFITRMDINGAASGVPAFYRDGQPVSVELALAFQEINIQTRDNFISTGGMDGGPSLGGGVR
jgi:hypothetical protein